MDSFHAIPYTFFLFPAERIPLGSHFLCLAYMPVIIHESFRKS